MRGKPGEVHALNPNPDPALPDEPLIRPCSVQSLQRLAKAGAAGKSLET